jgi:NAD(P)-dependent dehydrogenase (short-subunit alcohol dehydrogenase family)
MLWRSRGPGPAITDMISATSPTVRVICHALAKEGAHIAVIYAQSRDEAEAVAGELTSRHQINATAFACDVTDGAAVQRLIGDVTVRFGRLDVLVNDAAYNKSIPFTDLDNLTLEVWNTYAMDEPVGPSPATDAMLTMRPRPSAFMTGATALMRLIGPVRLTAIRRRPHPPHALHGSGVGAGDTRQLCRTRTAGRHAGDV